MGKDIAGTKAILPLWVRLLCWFAKTVNSKFRNHGRIDRRLGDILEPKVPASEIPSYGVSTKDIMIDDINNSNNNNYNGVWVRLYSPVMPEQTDSSMDQLHLPIVFYFHGGGFVAFSASCLFYDIFCRRLARRRSVIVISVNYRLAPEHKYPAAYEDCLAAIKWACSHGQLHLPSNADMSRCFLMGDSAGGNIVHRVGCRIAEATELISPMKIVGHILVQPFFGGQERTEAEKIVVGSDYYLLSVENCDWFWNLFLPEGADRNHAAANVFGPNSSDISGLALPPTLVVVGGQDLLRDWQLRYFENMKKLNKDVELIFYKEAIHSFHTFRQLTLSSQFIADLDKFMQKAAK
eukprot:Gb_39438 [translate_table: standard]